MKTVEAGKFLGVLSWLVVAILGLTGCAEFMAQRQQAVAQQQQRESAMRAAARAEDGYQYLDGDNGGPFQAVSNLQGQRWKSCTTLKRYLLEPGEPTAVSYDANFRGYVQPLIDQGKLPRDLYYAAAGTSQLIVSVPLADRAAMAKNMEEGDVCIWSAGKIDRFQCPKPSSSCAVFYATLEKWDGVLKHDVAMQATPGAAAPSIPQAVPGAGGTSSSGASVGASTPAVSAPASGNVLLGKWRADQVANVTMEFRPDEFRWMAMMSTIRKVKYEADGNTVLVIQTDGGGQVERFKVIDANHMAHVQPMVGEMRFTRISGGGQ